VPAFAIMLALSATYAAVGMLPAIRGAFYGIGPVVLGIFAAAVWRLGRNAIRERAQALVALAAAAAMVADPAAVAVILLAAGCAGVALFHSRRAGRVALAAVVAVYALARLLDVPSAFAPASSAAGAPSLWNLGAFFFKVGALTFGGGLSMLAFMQEQVVGQLGWLAPREFIDGLAIGQLTPGPVLMLAAFVGYKTAGVAGAAVAAAAIFLPSFLMMLSILPLLARLGDLRWLKAFMRGAAPAVIGALAVSLAQMAPHAAPDPFTWALLAVTIALATLKNTGALPLMAAGGALGWAARRVLP
jgi:chromate transporter